MDDYLKNVKCENCDKEKYFIIPKGVSYKKYLSIEMCEFCGCDIIQKKIRNKN
jgi:hypothetical protein